MAIVVLVSSACVFVEYQVRTVVLMKWGTFRSIYMHHRWNASLANSLAHSILLETLQTVWGSEYKGRIHQVHTLVDLGPRDRQSRFRCLGLHAKVELGHAPCEIISSYSPYNGIIDAIPCTSSLPPPGIIQHSC